MCVRRVFGRVSGELALGRCSEQVPLEEARCFTGWLLNRLRFLRGCLLSGCQVEINTRNRIVKGSQRLRRGLIIHRSPTWGSQEIDLASHA